MRRAARQVLVGALAAGPCLLPPIAGARAADELGRERAQTARVIVVCRGLEPAVAAALASELRAQGYEPALLERAPTDESFTLATLGSATSSAFAARIVQEARALRVELLATSSGKSLQRELPASEGGAGVVALRLAEALRAGMLELSLADAPPATVEAASARAVSAPAPVSESNVVTSATPPALPSPAAAASNEAPAAAAVTDSSGPRRAALELGAALLVGRGLGVVPALAAGIGFYPVPDVLRVTGFGLIPLTAMAHRAAEGESETRVTIAGVEARLEWAFGELRPSLGAGLDLALLSTRGRSDGARFESSEDSDLSPGAFVRPGLALDLTSGIALSLQLMAGVQRAYFSIDYAGRSAARWGAEWGAASVALEGRLW